MKAGVIGLGDMGSGLALNLIQNGFETFGFDIDDNRCANFQQMGGNLARNVAEVGVNADAIFVMVMNGDQAKSVIFGDDGLVGKMAKGGIILLTATIKPSEAQEIGAALSGTGIALIDSPVSGGFQGRKLGL